MISVNDGSVREDMQEDYVLNTVTLLFWCLDLPCEVSDLVFLQLEVIPQKATLPSVALPAFEHLIASTPKKSCWLYYAISNLIF